MAELTLTERHARIGKALDKKEKRLGWMLEAIARGQLAAAPDTVSPVDLSDDYAALLSFARAEWERAGKITPADAGCLTRESARGPRRRGCKKKLDTRKRAC